MKTITSRKKRTLGKSNLRCAALHNWLNSIHGTPVKKLPAWERLIPSIVSRNPLINYGVHGCAVLLLAACDKHRNAIYQHQYHSDNKIKRRAQRNRLDHLLKLNDPAKFAAKNARKIARESERRRNDPVFAVRRRLGQLIHSAIRDEIADVTMREVFGCSRSEFLRHIEEQFKVGMEWGNYGKHGWCIDHRVPCSAFNLLNPAERKKCFHYTNLQPLWLIENYKKSNFLPNV